MRKFGLGARLALGFESLVTVDGVTIVVVVAGGVLIGVVGVEDEFVGVVGLVGVVGVVDVVVGVAFPAGCLDLRNAADAMLLATPRELVWAGSAVVDATIAPFLSVRNVVPGALADTGSATTAKVRTLSANASDPPIAARRARFVSGNVIRRHTETE
ncbi:MAG: hypothetical protein ABSE75_08830 [Acidimicrobiales bacterium]